jgi:hypothetical protein
VKKVDEPVVVADSSRRPLDEKVEQRERGRLTEWPVCRWRDVWAGGDERARLTFVERELERRFTSPLVGMTGERRL